MLTILRLNKRERENRSLRGLSISELKQFCKERQDSLGKLHESKMKYEVALDRNLRKDPTSAQILIKKLDIVCFSPWS